MVKPMKQGNALKLSFKRDTPDGISVIDDPSGFAFGGIYPGTLHAHGKCFESHKVSFSIGVSGLYLLHVRLHQQAASLPGSPFTLQVDPGPAYALSSTVPEVIDGEVGEKRTMVLNVADKAGNRILMGSECKAVVTCTAPGHEKEASMLEASVLDENDGLFKLSWYAKISGSYETHIKVNGMHVINSPAKVVMRSTRPVIGKSKLSGPGLIDAQDRQPTSIRVLLLDEYDNVSVPGENFQLGLSLINVKERKPTDDAAALPLYEHVTGAWTFDDEKRKVYELTYTPNTPGVHQLYVWCDPESSGTRSTFANMPVSLNIDRSQSDVTASAGSAANGEGGAAGDAATAEASAKAQQEAALVAKNARMQSTKVEGPTHAPGDYSVAKDVFDDCQEKWGKVSIDAFSSEATALLPRYWTESPVMNSEGTDAFKQEWGVGERIWCHPPTEKLDAVVKLLKGPDRIAEVLVCAPLWKSNAWFLDLMTLADDRAKYRAGKLSRVADDAPDRLEVRPH